MTLTGIQPAIIKMGIIISMHEHLISYITQIISYIMIKDSVLLKGSNGQTYLHRRFPIASISRIRKVLRRILPMNYNDSIFKNDNLQVNRRQDI